MIVMMVMMIRQVPLAFTEELSMVLDMFGLQSSSHKEKIVSTSPSYICENRFRETK